MEPVQIFTQSPLRNYTYILVDENSRSAISIDPFDSEEIQSYLESRDLTLQKIINTHEHWDHTKGNSGLLENSPHCKICCHFLARKKIESANTSLKKGDIISFGESWIRVLETPGHTDAHICLVVGKGNSPEYILTGDTLFNAGVGNCKNGGNPEILYQTIAEQFHTLPDSLKVYPGHDYWKTNLEFTLAQEPENLDALQLLEEVKSNLNRSQNLISTIGLERKVNLFFRLNNAKTWKDSVFTGLDIEKDIFLQLRRLRDSW